MNKKSQKKKEDPYSTGEYIQYPVTNYNGKKIEKNYMLTNV